MTKGDNILLQAKELFIGYDNAIVEDINVSLPKGELVCLVGANGSGKSTLLKTLIGFEPPLSGKILFQDQELSLLPSKQKAKTISIALTGNNFNSDITVKEFVTLGRHAHTNLLGKLNKEDLEIIDQSIQSVGIDELKNKSINQISDGEKQKATIARSLAQKTPIIILDEPTSFLDITSKFDLLSLLKTLAKEEQKSIILTTHDLELALKLADAVWLIHDKNLQSGSPEQMVQSGLINKAFDSKTITFDQNSTSFRPKETN